MAHQWRGMVALIPILPRAFFEITSTSAEQQIFCSWTGTLRAPRAQCPAYDWEWAGYRGEMVPGTSFIWNVKQQY